MEYDIKDGFLGGGNMSKNDRLMIIRKCLNIF